VKSPKLYSRLVLVSLTAATVSLSLLGCGQKGPLFLAKPPERVIRTAPAADVDNAATAATPVKK